MRWRSEETIQRTRNSPKVLVQVAVATSFRMIDGLGHDSLDESLRARATLGLLEAARMAHTDYVMWLLCLQMPTPPESTPTYFNLSPYSGTLYYSSYY
ncbi:hypothetical protein J3458_000984 [Metarhizium acridum]|uniref:uncharacterized protein n=1 Tax=Metarhizium acridum TaxID=92637 RepID=UPI001C6C3935|nr:hypothetical protein J3458_000984 [Metarhizium acridum]